MKNNKCFLRREKPLVIGVPSSILDTEPGLREKTLKITLVFRAAAVFRVDEVVVYNDETIPSRVHDRYVRLIKKVYKYLVTPPYLRKKLVPIDKDLTYVGASPPLRLHVFDVEKNPVEGEYRVGVVVESKDGYVLVDGGLDEYIKVVCKTSCPKEGDVVVVRITSINPLKAVYDAWFMEKLYLGPSLSTRDLVKSINYYRGERFYLIATSRKGRVVNLKLLSSLANVLRGYRGVYVLFGGPRLGLYEILSNMGYDLEELVDIVVNTVPLQGTKTVRTEEAIYATLSLLNII